MNGSGTTTKYSKSILRTDLFRTNSQSRISQKANELVAEAKSAAKEGNVEKAERLAGEALEFSPNNEDAILVRCDISESLAEKKELLERCLAINPRNEAAKSELEKVEQQRLSELLEDAEELISQEDLKGAETLLSEAAEINSEDEKLLLLQVDLASSSAEKKSILEKILAANSECKAAHQKMREINSELAAGVFSKASAEAAKGHKEEAKELLQQVFIYDPEQEDAWMLVSPPLRRVLTRRSNVSGAFLR